jgi:hypothetical protein
LAAVIAGRNRSSLKEEWHAHLAGESGHEVPTWGKVWAALGFVVSSIRYRYQDGADVVWIPIDTALKSRTISNIFVLFPTVLAAWMVLIHEGTTGLLASTENISVIGGTLYAVIRLGRWWRNVKPPEPKARRAKE